LAGVLAWLSRSAARSGREAIGLTLLLGALVTYPAVQFSTRHLFHLEFVWNIGVLSLPVAASEWRLLRPVLPRVLAGATLVLGGAAGSHAGLAALQQRALTAEIEALLDQPRRHLAPVREDSADGSILWRIAPPAEARAILDAPPDSMTNRIAEVGVQHDVRAVARRFVLTLGGPSCPAGPVALGLAYDHRPEVWQPLDSTLSVAPGEVAVVPGFYRGTQAFAGLRLPASHARCDVGVESLPLAGRLPAVFSANLPPEWRSLPLRKGLGRFATRRE
jgi:hypothetical protein